MKAYRHCGNSRSSEAFEEYYVTALRRCASTKDLKRGRSLHCQLLNAEQGIETYIANSIVKMYGSCGSIEDCKVVFDDMKRRNKFTWNLMILAYAQNGYLQEGRRLLDVMPGRDIISWTTLVATYAQNGCLDEAAKLFVSMPETNVVSWNAMVSAYAQNGRVEDASSVYEKMPERDFVSWNAMLAGFAQNGLLEKSKIVFDQMPQWDVPSWNAMITAYGKNNHLRDARKIFDDMPERSVISWTAMIGACAENGYENEAFKLFRAMDLEGVQPNKITLITILEACCDINTGRFIHQDISNCDCSSSIPLYTSLVHMYSRCGSLEDARKVFEMMPEDVVVLTVMISAYAQSGDLSNARATFEKIARKDVVAWNAMIAAYATNGNMEKASALFDVMQYRDVVTWNALIAAYAQNGSHQNALKQFRYMDLEGIHPDRVTFVCVLDGCIGKNGLADGKIIHSCIVGSGFDSELIVANALVNMYGKCGVVIESRTLFDKMVVRDLMSWNTMISAYSQNGHTWEAMELLKVMILDGQGPNEVTFVSILSACSHSGLLGTGLLYFASLHADYGIAPVSDHCVCVIDLIGRSGQLEKAEEVIDKMPFKATTIAWNTLLSACHVHSAGSIATRAADHVMNFNDHNSAPYVMLSNTVR